MNILNAKDNKNDFINQLTIYLESLDDEDYYYGPTDFYEYLLENHSMYENIDFVMDENEFKGVLLKSNVEGLKLMKLIGYFDDSIYDIISKKYPDTIVFIDGYTSDKPFEYYNLANTKASNEKEDYITPGLMSFLVPKSMSENIIRDKIEELIMPKFDKEKLVFEDKTGSEILDEILYKYDDNPFFNGFSKGENGHRHLAGFHYLSLDESDRNQKILLCKLDGQIIGAVKHGLYEGYGHIPHQGLAYIDVNINYRNLGIAKMLIKELDNYLDKTLPLFLTDESDMGRLCHMERLFVEHIKSTDCIPYKQQEEYYTKNKDRIPELKNYFRKITGKDIER